MPPARHQAGEQAVLGSVIVEVKGLRIELACKRLDLCRVHDVCFAGEALPHLEVIEIKRIVASLPKAVASNGVATVARQFFSRYERDII